MTIVGVHLGIQGNPNTVAKDEFQEVVEGCGITEADNEILDRLFIMLDKTGDQQINFREVSPLSLCLLPCLSLPLSLSLLSRGKYFMCC